MKVRKIFLKRRAGVDFVQLGQLSIRIFEFRNSLIVYDKDRRMKMKFQESMLLLYAVTDRAWTGKQSLYEQIEAAIKGGATMIQLREKKLSKEEFLKEAKEIRALCHTYHIPLIINDDVEIALASGADGVHVGIEDMPVAEIRKKVGQEFIIGATAKTVEQAKMAQEAGADYLGVGAVFPSPTKTNAIRISKEQLQAITQAVSIPVVAIGGINKSNMQELQNTSIAGVALVSEIFSALDIETNTRERKEQILQVLGKMK